MRNECDPISGVTFDRPSSFSCFQKAEVFLIPCQQQARRLNRPTKPLQPKVHLVAQPVGHRDGRSFLERRPGGFQRYCHFRNRNILGKSAKATRGYVPEYLITGLKLRDVAAHRFDPPREGRAEDLVFWFEKPIREAHQEWLSAQKMPVTRSGGCRKNFYQDFMVRGRRFFYLFELKNIR